MNDKQRAEFEEWARENTDFFEFKQFSGRIRENGNYACKDEQKAFVVWQAAIASVVVELPFEDSCEMHAGAVCAALDKAGISYE